VRRKDHAVYNGAPNIRYGTSSSSHHKTYFAEADLALALAFIAQQRIQLDILLGTSALSSPTLVQQQRRKSRRLSNRHGKGDHGGSSSSSSSGRQHPEAENNPTSMLSSTSWAQLAASTTAAAGVTSSAPRSTDASLSNTEGSKDLGFKDPFEQLTPAPKVEHLLASATAAPRPWIGHLRGTLDGQGHIRRTPQSREHNVYVLRYRPLLHFSKRFFLYQHSFRQSETINFARILLLSTTFPIVPCSRNSNESKGTKTSNATSGAP